MKREYISNAVGNIDTRHIQEAAPVAVIKKKAHWARWGAIAACVCLVAGSMVVAWHTRETSTSKTDENYVVQIYQTVEQGHEPIELYSLPYTDAATDLYIPVTLSNGTEIPIVVIAAESEAGDAENQNMTLDEAESYAYLDPDTASDELREKILAARKIIIYSKSWTADGYIGYIQNVETGERTQLPSFSELFPGWDIPTSSISTDSITEDGLGADVLYGLTVEIVDISEEYIDCRIVGESSNIFYQSEDVQVYLPDEINSDLLNVGDMIFVTYLGADYDMAKGIIHARMITDSMESANHIMN